MFPHNADEARYFEHEMSIRLSVEEAQRRLEDHSGATVAVLAVGGVRVEGEWVAREGRQVAVFRTDGDRLVTTLLAEVDVIAVEVAGRIESGDRVVPGREREAIEEALVHLSLGKMGVAEAYRQEGMETALADDVRLDDPTLSVGTRGEAISKLFPRVRMRPKDEGIKVEQALETICRDMERRGVDRRHVEELRTQFAEFAGKRLYEIPTDPRHRLSEALGRIEVAKFADERVTRYMRHEKVREGLRPYVVPRKAG